MKTQPRRPWWLRKRILFPLTLLLGLVVTGGIAFENSDASSVVVYNLTGRPLPPLLIRVGGQSRSFPTLAEEESVRLTLAPGAAGAVHLELATDPPWKWEGDLLRPRGGYRMTIRLWPEGQAEVFTDVSWWRRWLND